MKIAFCLFNYFPFGGLQRDFLRIATECLARNHTVDVYVMNWEGEIPPGINVKLTSGIGLTNHQRIKRFIKSSLKKIQAQDYHCVVGFNKMPGLDIYYAADSCYVAKAHSKHSWLYQLSRRYQHYAAFEKAVATRQMQR